MDSARLRLKRGNVKASITQLEKWVAQKAQEAGSAELEVRIRKLKKYEQQFDDIQTQLDAAVDAEDFDAEQQERLDIDERLSVLESSLLEFKNAFDTSTALNETANNISLDLVTSDLPQIELPKFNGEYLDYPQFIDTFNALVHNVKSRGMTDIRRFGLLKSTLTGKARDAVANVPLVAGNYTVALEILKERFFKPRLIFTSYIRKLWEAPKATGTGSLRQLCDTHSSIRKGLELIATPEQISCGIMIQLMLTKCDQKTVEEWERVSATKDDLPGDNEFSDFLRKRCTQLEGIDYAVRTVSKPPPTTKPPQKRVANTATGKVMCPVCKGNHCLSKCPDFLHETPKGRYITAKKHNVCIKCLLSLKDHKACKQACEICAGAHNQLLHFDTSSSGSPPKSNQTAEGSASGSVPSSSNTAQVTTEDTGATSPHTPSLSAGKSTNDPSCDTYTFLATAVVHARSVDGNYIPLRILFDGGSQLNLISERARSLLGIPSVNTMHRIHLSGINNSSVTLRKRVVVEIKSPKSEFHDSVVLMVHPRMRQVHPSQLIDVSGWKVPDGIGLADPKFNHPQQIDIILNAHHVDTYMLSQWRTMGPNLPRLRETKFGWVVVGDWAVKQTLRASTNIGTAVDSCRGTPEPTLSQLVQKFWELESTQAVKLFSPDETQMEEHFRRTHERMSNGRFMVRLPFSRSPELLGESRGIAAKRLAMITRKMAKDPEYARSYIDFMDEYRSLRHCTEAPLPESKAPHYYIPHFAVTNENSTTTRTRIVFDASCRTENEICLNELLMVGPKLQDDLFVHLLRFRMYAYVLTGDVSKMYRQILVHPHDRKYQYVLWKSPDDHQIRTYELNTVTYGTASAPFHAVRCMQELARTDGDDVPLGQQVLLNDFYVDDMLTGADDESSLIEIHKQVKTLFSRGQMDIRKFQSNSRKVMEDIPLEDQGTFLTIGENEVLKTLGMIWRPNSDEFAYYYNPTQHTTLTRRVILSEISRLFDPLGLIQPVIVRAKLFMQRLYAATSDWDEPVTPDDAKNWDELRRQLIAVGEITFPRPAIETVATKVERKFEIHCFCDASELAYAAAIFVRSISLTKNSSECHLLTSKTRVAPLKKVSLPRLELCGALLMSELYETVRPHIPLEISAVYFWTDSTITLRWVTESPHKWTSFVATRATKIQTTTKDGKWNHIPSELNPADLATRGMAPQELQESVLWKNGPAFLNSLTLPWPVSRHHHNDDDVPEKAKVVTSLTGTTQTDLFRQLKIMSFVPLISAAMWPKLRRIFGYVHRFISRLLGRLTTRIQCRLEARLQERHQPPPGLVKVEDVPPLTVSEIQKGGELIIQLVQRLTFHKEIKMLTNEQPLPSKSMFGKLSVFLDKNKLLRVGGRMSQAAGMPYDEKHALLLPHDHVVTRLIVTWYHFENLHAGPKALLAIVRQMYWPLNGQVLANQTVHSCIRCSRAKPVTFQQIMGDLPKDRVTPSPPFTVTAVDFAGPFSVHYRLRGSRPTKVYMAVFVCFSTKAVHLELVEDLTVGAFINCLIRFTNRRNCPVKIWSDNATNFVAASRKLEDFKKFYWQEETQKAISNWCRDVKEVTWAFVPPRSPHFNGLAEAAVKSAKYHLSRLPNIDSLTFQELNTVVIMIEGILNSRPLMPLSCSPDDGQPLTPAHFLVGNSLRSVPEPRGDETSSKTWDKTIAIKQAFWRKWSKEYLKTLQEKHKWQESHPEPKIDDLVLLVDKDLAPLKWKIAKVVQLHTGKDGKVRVVDVQTDTGTYCRAITELCPVPRVKTTVG